MTHPNQPWGQPQQPWQAPPPGQPPGGWSVEPPEGWGMEPTGPRKRPSSAPMVIALLIVMGSGLAALLMVVASMGLLVAEFGNPSW